MSGIECGVAVLDALTRQHDPVFDLPTSAPADLCSSLSAEHQQPRSAIVVVTCRRIPDHLQFGTPDHVSARLLLTRWCRTPDCLRAAPCACTMRRTPTATTAPDCAHRTALRRDRRQPSGNRAAIDLDELSHMQRLGSTSASGARSRRSFAAERAPAGTRNKLARAPPSSRPRGRVPRSSRRTDPYRVGPARATRSRSCAPASPLAPPHCQG